MKHMKHSGLLAISFLVVAVAACSSAPEDDDFTPGTSTPNVPADPFSAESAWRSADSKDLFLQLTASFDGFVGNITATSATACSVAFEATETIEVEAGTQVTFLVDEEGTCGWSAGAVDYRVEFVASLEPDFNLHDDFSVSPSTTFPAGSANLTVSDAFAGSASLQWTLSANPSTFIDELRIYDSTGNLMGGCDSGVFVPSGAQTLLEVCSSAVVTSDGTYGAAILGNVPGEIGNYYQYSTFTLP